MPPLPLLVTTQSCAKSKPCPMELNHRTVARGRRLGVHPPSRSRRPDIHEPLQRHHPRPSSCHRAPPQAKIDPRHLMPQETPAATPCRGRHCHAASSPARPQQLLSRPNHHHNANPRIWLAPSCPDPTPLAEPHRQQHSTIAPPWPAPAQHPRAATVARPAHHSPRWGPGRTAATSSSQAEGRRRHLQHHAPPHHRSPPPPREDPVTVGAAAGPTSRSHLEDPWSPTAEKNGNSRRHRHRRGFARRLAPATARERAGDRGGSRGAGGRRPCRQR